VADLSRACERTFARHETFHPRYGWFRKAATAAAQDPSMFLREDATVELGVGKNMVKAIRFWGQAAKLICEVPNPERPRVPLVAPTRAAVALFDETRGADPWLELPGTLWLLHWLLLRPPCLLPVWWVTFNGFNGVEFVEEDLLSLVADEITTAGWEQPTPSSIHKDISCLTRTYSFSDEGRQGFDDLLDSPLRDLGLIEPVWGERSRHRLVPGSKATLPDLVLLYAVLDWVAVSEETASTVAITRILNEPGSPGRAFRLTESSLLDALKRALRDVDVASITTAAGSLRLALATDPGAASQKALAGYYAHAGSKLRLPITEPEVPADFSQGMLVMA